MRESGVMGVPGAGSKQSARLHIRVFQAATCVGGGL